MARQENTCWRCGTLWAAEDEPRTRLTVIAGGATTARAAPDAGLDADRWTNEGGRVDSEAPARVVVSQEAADRARVRLP
jgi:hypothetical protein